MKLLTAALFSLGLTACASTGVEQFAYIPGSVNFTTMATLANPNYSHAYLNDGEVVVSDLATVGKNILVGSLDRKAHV